MKEKPRLRLTLLAEESLEIRIRAYYREGSLETEYHQYSFTTLGDLNNSRAIVLLCSADAPLTLLQKECLLFASRFGLPLFVGWLNCGKLKNQLATEEVALRQVLFAQGFDGDSATIIRFYAGFMEEHLPRLLSALDANASLLQAPQKTPAPFPETQPDSLAKLLLALDGFCSLGLEVSFSPANPIERTLSTKMGGMPYLEIGEVWPCCRLCKSSMKFLWQVDASKLLPTESPLGLYVFYLCDSTSHPENFFIRRYQTPSLEKMCAPTKEIYAPLRQKGAPMYSGHISTWSSPARYVPSRELLKSQKGTKDLLSMLTLSKKEEVRAVRQELQESLSAEGTMLENTLLLLCARETKTKLSTPFFGVGGYFVPKGTNPFGEECACKHCKKRMQSLPFIRSERAWPFSLSGEHLFLVCSCTPDDVIQVIPKKAV